MAPAHAYQVFTLIPQKHSNATPALLFIAMFVCPPTQPSVLPVSLEESWIMSPSPALAGMDSLSTALLVKNALINAKTVAPLMGLA